MGSSSIVERASAGFVLGEGQCVVVPGVKGIAEHGFLHEIGSLLGPSDRPGKRCVLPQRI
jgi:hypothetical protein